MSHPPSDPDRPPILVAVPTPPRGETRPRHALGRPRALADVLVGLAVRQAAPALAGWAAVLAAAVVGWRLRFRVSQDARNWQRGARGERRTAHQLRRLTRHGWAVLHDLAIPGSGANADHLAVGPGGTFLLDSKNWRGRLAVTPDGTLWSGSYPLTTTLATIGWEAQGIADALTIPGHSIQPIMAVHGSTIPWGEQYLGGVAIVSAGRLAAILLALPPLLTDQQVAQLVQLVIARIRPAA